MPAFTSATRLLVLGFQDISTVLLVGTLLGLLFPAWLFPKKTSLTRWPVLFNATMGALVLRLLVQFLGGGMSQLVHFLTNYSEKVPAWDECRRNSSNNIIQK